MSRKTNKENKTVVNNWNFRDTFGAFPSIRWLCKFFLALIVINTLLGMANVQLTENKDVYTTCVSSCKIPTTTGVTLKAFDKEFMSVNPKHITGIPSCIESCNEMYLILRYK